MSKTIITIGRQYGSGGREIGEIISKSLDIPFYDRELILIAAQKGNMSPQILSEVDEKAAGNFQYSAVFGNYAHGARFSFTGENLPMNDRLFILQSEIIKKAANESCLIIGRCADYVLNDNPELVSVFVFADIKTRAERAVLEYGDSSERIYERLKKIDKARANYYNFYSDRKWGRADNYNLCIDSGSLGIKNSAELIEDFVRMRAQHQESQG